MVADGNFRSVIDAAEARGVEATLGRGSLSDVVALSDAARYLHDRSLAKRGLSAQRARFPGSAEAHVAAFVLGRFEEEDGSRAEAVRLYDAYMTESPRGAFVAEALGRKLVALVEGGDTAAAQAVARDYLRRYPRGPHADYARGLLGP
jgi:TolA-binding protein